MKQRKANRILALLLVAGAGVVPILGADDADAQPLPGPSAARGPGRDALDRGLALLRQQHWIEAMPHLEESVRLESTPLGWFNLALAYRGAGRIAAAVGAFERYLAVPEADAPAARLTAIRAELTGLLRSVARLQVSITPPGAVVRVDGRDTAMTAGELRLDPGTHAISFEAPGHETQRRELNLQAGATLVLELYLRPTVTVPVAAPPVAAPPLATPTNSIAAPVAAATGQLIVEPSEASSAVFVDGSPRGAGPTAVSLALGEHRVEVRATGRETWARIVQIQPGGTTRLSQGLAVQGGGRGWVLPVAITGGAVVVTAVVIGIAFATRGMATPTQGSWDTRQEP